ncbi:hypothetical protein FDP41_001617 [Naegleria fowleri]|uniref:Uncharacterized protein n=1 Tax=Naegleria fowleri TaxID=5763 RepID=A0A6A5BY80_NAEFO|nr:uncharacterized protein FDP41_001617 [Naegleria fowleri]KAF0979274.1 hypothetical protein FDP41_001617 [Naegleria fowleri]
MDSGYITAGFLTGTTLLLGYLLKQSSSSSKDESSSSTKTLTKEEIEDMLAKASKEIESGLLPNASDERTQKLNALKQLVKCVYDLYDIHYTENLPVNKEIDCECAYGFRRDEFKDPNDKLVGKVTAHNSLLLYLTRVRATEWDANPEETQFPLLSKAATLLKKKKVKISVAEAYDGEKVEGNTFVMFPEQVKFTNVKDEVELEKLVNFVLTGQGSSDVDTSKIERDIKQSTILICCHHQRDQRCGYCGPRLYESFRDFCIRQQVDIVLRRANHLGGHKYAGNVVVIYQNKKMQKQPWFIDWYGYVDLSDVERLMYAHFDFVDNPQPSYRVIKELWKGRPSMNKEMFEKFLMMQ